MTRRIHIPVAARTLALGAALAAALLPTAKAGAAAQSQLSAGTAAVVGGHPAIVLPPVLVAGKPATLAVLDALGRPAANVTVNVGGGVMLTTDATGRAELTAPDSQGVLRAALPDGTAEASATVIAAAAEETPGLRVDLGTRTLLLRDRFTIRGAGFHGVADENRVVLAGQPAAVLAASPVALVALPNPRTALGETQLVVESSGLTATTSPVSVISLELSSDKGKGLPGEMGEVRVTVRGTDRPVDFEVRAEPEGRIEMARGNPSRGRTSGGASNAAAIAFKFRQPGEFFFEVRRVAEPLGLPDTDAAQRELLEARHLAPRGWTKRVDRVLQLVAKHPQDVAEARDALEKMLAKKPEGEFGQHLEAAWKILLNRE
ncbi:MAG TPA: hypothetical protein VJX29_11005 [Candidatus Acidoferrales bacterium]|nr:hypothetical protein [Candidatus Acidoferrales bacterium]